MLKTIVLEMCDKTDFWRTSKIEKGGKAQGGQLKTENYGMHASSRVI